MPIAHGGDHAAKITQYGPKVDAEAPVARAVASACTLRHKLRTGNSGGSPASGSIVASAPQRAHAPLAELRVDLLGTSARVPAGWRVRLAVRPQNAIRTDLI